MIIVGSIIILVIFVLTGWAVTTEMMQQRLWRRKVASGDTSIIGALVEEALASWRRARPPKDIPANLWAGVQGAQLAAVTGDSATLSGSAEPAFRTEGGQRTQVASALDEAFALASKLIDMILYDVPNLRLDRVRVDVYSTFTGADGAPIQQPILTSMADRLVADELPWEALTPEEILARFETDYRRGEGGRPAPIVLPPIEGTPPQRAEGAATETVNREGLKDSD